MAHFYASSLPHPSSFATPFNFAGSVVDYWAAQDPGLLALHWVSSDHTLEQKLTFSDFSRESHRIATLLSELGLKPGDVVILILPRLPEWWAIVTACLRAGIVVCPCTTLLVDKDIEYRVQVAEAKCFIGDAVSAGKCQRVRSACPTLQHVLQIGEPAPASSDTVSFARALAQVPQDVRFHVPSSLTSTSPALLFFTSGTTGPPKLARHNQTSYPLAHTNTGKHWLRLRPGQLYWNISEQGWAKAAWSFFGAWNCGAALFVVDDRGAFDAKKLLATLHKYPITTLCAPPTAYRQLVLDAQAEYFAAHPPMKLEHCCGAGEPLNESVIDRWKSMTGGIEVWDGYGQTETVLICANQAGWAVRPGSMGRAMPGVPLTVIDADGNDTGPAEEGDIAIRMPADGDPHGFFGIFDGYVDTKTGRLDRRIRTLGPASTRFYITGDRARRDADGYFWFVGRSDDVINSAGYRIGPFEVESTLKLHPAVVESAVVSSPDPDRVEVVKAFVVLTDAARPASAAAAAALVKTLQDFCKTHAAPYKYPRKIEFVAADQLPKTISGKIKRVELRDREWKEYREAQRKTGAKL